MSSESEVSPGAANQLREMWDNRVAAEHSLGPRWNAAFANWIEKFGFGLVADAVQKASVAGYSEDGERLPPNIQDVPKYAAVEQAEEKEPGMRECYFVRGRIRKKFYCQENDDEVLSLLRTAMREGVSGSAMHHAVDESDTLEDCFTSMGIERSEFRVVMGHPIVDLPQKRQVFIRENEPEWLIWDAYWRKTKGVGPPMNKDFGWFFPSRLPPAEPQARSMSGK